MKIMIPEQSSWTHQVMQAGPDARAQILEAILDGVTIISDKVFVVDLLLNRWGVPNTFRQKLNMF